MPVDVKRIMLAALRSTSLHSVILSFAFILRLEKVKFARQIEYRRCRTLITPEGIAFHDLDKNLQKRRGALLPLYPECGCLQQCASKVRRGLLRPRGRPFGLPEGFALFELALPRRPAVADFTPSFKSRHWKTVGLNSALGRFEPFV
jgi:hypothetical protein